MLATWEANGRLLADIKACSRNRDLVRARELHSEASRTGQLANKYVANCMITMFSRCGSLEEARAVFDGMRVRRDVVSWNALIQGYVENADWKVALESFDEMLKEADPNARSYVSALTACGNLAEEAKRRCESCSRRKWLARGKALHSRALSERLLDEFVVCTVVDMYGKCGEMRLAREVFERCGCPSIVVWNSLLQGYVENGQSVVALELFDQLLGYQRSVCVPTSRTYVAALTAIAALASNERDATVNAENGHLLTLLSKGKAIHSRAITHRCCDQIVQNVLIDMYSKCGDMVEAQHVFDRAHQRNTVGWNALIQGYADNGQEHLALKLFERMSQGVDGCLPDARTYVATLTALGNRADEAEVLERVKSLHKAAVRNGSCDVFVETALVDVYGKCRCMSEAQRLFECMACRDVVSWTALARGYVENGESRVALRVIARMDMSGVGLDSKSFIAALTACKSLVAVENGVELHEELRNRGLEKDITVANCLIDFYGRCGRMQDAKKAFDDIGHKNVVTWNVLLCGYAQQGYTGEALQLFHMMRRQGVRPDGITFTHALTACTAAGLTEEGKKLFNAMREEHGVSPTMEHYACMVGLLARANCIDEAVKVVRDMPYEPDAVIWCSLLAACSEWNDVPNGRLAYEALLELREKDSVAHVLMSNMFGAYHTKVGLGKNPNNG